MNSGESDFRASHQLSENYKNTLNLFGDSITYSKLASLHFQGAKVKSTPITENFGFEEYQQQYGARAVPMFALDDQKKIHIFTTERELKPAPGWVVIAMITPEKNTDEEASNAEDVRVCPDCDQINWVSGRTSIRCKRCGHLLVVTR